MGFPVTARSVLPWPVRGAQADQIKPWLERKGLLGMHTVGLVCPSPINGNGANGNGYHGNGSTLPVLGSIEAMGDILKTSSITQLIVLDLSLGPEQLSKLTQLYDGAAVRMLAIHDLDSYFNHTTMTFEDDGNAASLVWETNAPKVPSTDASSEPWM